jgi:hypothetical protein
LTAQIPDKLAAGEKTYDILAAQGTGLFDPAAYGMKPEMIHTACYRGYYCSYGLQEDQLFLQSLTIRSANGEHPPLQGKAPTREPRLPAAVYHDIALPIKFSGSLTLGSEFDSNRYIHMGFQNPSAYGVVVEAVFEHGRLTFWNTISDRFSAQAQDHKGSGDR